MMKNTAVGTSYRELPPEETGVGYECGKLLILERKMLGLPLGKSGCELQQVRRNKKCVGYRPQA